MAVSKRARSNSKTANKKQMVVYTGPPAQMVVPGYTRNVGTYGRFHGGNGRHSAPELKWLDEQALYNIGPGAKSFIAQSFNVVPQGTQASQRIGQRINIKSIGINFSAWMPTGIIPAASPQSHLLRLILVCDKQNNGLGFTTPDLLHDGVTPADPSAQSFRNLTNSGRFQVLSDTRYNLNYNAITGIEVSAPGFVVAAQTLTSGQIWKDVNLPIEYGAGGTGALSEIRSNNLAMVMVLESQPLAGLAGVSIFLQSRIRYED